MHRDTHLNYSTLLALITFFTITVGLTACQRGTAHTGSAEVDLGKVMETVAKVQGGWKPQEEVKSFTKDTLFDLMDGQSDAFFVYGFEKAAVQRFQNEAGVQLNVSVFQVDAPDSAYGLFSVNRDPQSAAAGNEGSASPGRRLSFWQDRFFVQITALKPIDDADLLAVGKAISAALPKGGEKPALLKRLPAKDLSADPLPIYFHQELSIQDRVWLGGQNKLELGPDTDGVLARYMLDGHPAELMMIVYPTGGRAELGLQGLQSGEQVDLLAARIKGKTLAAVFGSADRTAAEALLALALK